MRRGFLLVLQSSLFEMSFKLELGSGFRDVRTLCVHWFFIVSCNDTGAVRYERVMLDVCSYCKHGNPIVYTRHRHVHMAYANI